MGDGPDIPYDHDRQRADSPSGGEVSNLAFAMYRMSHERCLTSSGPAYSAAPQFLCEGVEPWGAAVLRPSRQRWPGS